MKVALLSFHNAYNYGAALQAYALQCAVEKYGVACEYLNYQNEYRQHAYDMKFQFRHAVTEKKAVNAAKAFVGMPIMASRAKKFEEFFEKHLHVTNLVFHSSEEARETNAGYDKFIVGSDQVWNYSNNGGDTAFLLDFVDDDSKKISYSSSFGVSSFSSELAEEYGNYLRKFNRLSTRESIGVEMIKAMADRKAHLVLDPVFLVGKEKWDQIKGKNDKKEKRYIFLYTNRESQITDFLNTGYVTDEDLHVLSTHIQPGELLNRKIKTRIAMAPEEFLREIEAADLVVTASFHCLALSIIYHKPFVVILTGNHGKDERITNLLKITGLEERVLTSVSDKEDVLRPIDYGKVDELLEHYRRYSEEFLRRAIFDKPDIEFDEETEPALFCRDSRCTGCGACAAACPKHAICMVRNEEGFLIPQLCDAECVHCGKCHTVCQVYRKSQPIENQRYFAVKNSDEIRKASSSGGMFRAMAKEVFDEGGIVCAAGMDEQFHVRHMMAENPSEIAPMCATYYVQSEIGTCYEAIEAKLAEGKRVLFVGTGCQVKGLDCFLGKKYENLITCDIICHGVPSPMVFEKFLEYVGKRGKITEFMFRNKELGWKGYHVSATVDGALIKDQLWLQSFNNMFSHNMINRLSCGSCPYTNYHREGDITIGDFWGIEKSYPDFLDPLGISLVMTNTEKGNKLFERLDLPSVLSVEKAKTAQNSLLKPAPISSRRLQVFQSLRLHGYESTIRKYAEVSVKGRIKNSVRKAYIKTRS